jgi:hypothetical protein
MEVWGAHGQTATRKRREEVHTMKKYDGEAYCCCPMNESFDETEMNNDPNCCWVQKLVTWKKSGEGAGTSAVGGVTAEHVAEHA